MDLIAFSPMLAGVIAALTQALKRAGLPERAAPLVEIAVGVGATVAGVVTGAILVTTSAGSAGSAAVFWAVLYGAMSSLAAGGLYTYVSNAARGGSR